MSDELKMKELKLKLLNSASLLSLHGHQEHADACKEAADHMEQRDPFCWYRTARDITDEYYTDFSEDEVKPNVGNDWKPLFELPQFDRVAELEEELTTALVNAKYLADQLTPKDERIEQLEAEAEGWKFELHVAINVASGLSDENNLLRLREEKLEAQLSAIQKVAEATKKQRNELGRRYEKKKEHKCSVENFSSQAYGYLWHGLNQSKATPHISIEDATEEAAKCLRDALDAALLERGIDLVQGWLPIELENKDD